MTSNTSVPFCTERGSVRDVLLWLTLCLLLFTFGCGKSEPEDSERNDDSTVTTSVQGSDRQTSSPTKSTIQPKTDGDSGIVVELLDPGAEPRSALRYKFRAGRSETMVTVTEMSMTMEMTGQKAPESKMPPSQMTMTIDSKEVSPKGDLRYEFKLEKAEVLTDPNANPMMVAGMKQSLSNMVGMNGWATVTPRGFTTDAEIRMPPGADPMSERAMGNMRQSMKQMSAPLPDEPVGRGARWRVTMPLETNGMKITQTATYELLEIQGDVAKLNVAIEQFAEQEQINAPGAQSGTKTSLESLTSSGEGTVKLRTTDMVPTANINLTTTNVVSANNRKMKTTMKMAMKISPGN